MADLMHQFDRFHAVYKTLNDVNFEAIILVPRSIPFGHETKSPLLAHFHGGSLINGAALDPRFTSAWPLELAEAENAIIVSPAYRLQPEASATDILDDLHDFWTWAHSTLPSIVAKKWPHLTLDTDRVAVWGESAGGFLALQSAFLFPEARIRVCMPQYGAMYSDVKSYLSQYSNLPADQRVAAEKKFQEYMASVRPGAIRLASPFPEYQSVTRNIIMAGRKRGLQDGEPRMTLEYNLQNTKSLPPIWYAQGRDDTIMAPAASDELIQRLRQTYPDTPILYSVQPGEHGFDNDHHLTDPWVAEGVAFVRKYW